VTRSTRCSVCLHPRAAEADALLASGKAVRAVARVIGVDRNAMNRHHQNHFSAPASAEGRRVAADPTASTAEIMRGVVNDLRSVDTSSMTAHAKSVHLDNLRRATESLSRVEAPPPPPDDGRPTWEEIRRMNALMFEALEPFVGARQALARVLRAKVAGAREG